MKNVILVLGSGGARGIAHISVIRELERNGYTIKEIVGTSMGAFVGGMYAAGALELFANHILNMSKLDFLRVADPTVSGSGLIKGDRIFDIVREKVTSDVNIEDLPIPFSTISVDVKTNSIVRRNTGSLFNAIRSSIAIPNFFIPVPYENQLLVDGGVMCPLPISFAEKKSDNDIIVVVNLSGRQTNGNKTTDTKATENEKRNILRNQFAKIFPDLSFNYMELMTRSLELMQQELARLSLELHSPDIVINIPFDTCQILQFSKAKEVLKVGDKIAKEAITNYQTRG